MKLTFTEAGWEQYLYWRSHDKAVTKKINKLLIEIQRHPFEGMGKPEPLKGNLSAYGSRRISLKHRLVYSVANETVTIAQCRFHY